MVNLTLVLITLKNYVHNFGSRPPFCIQNGGDFLNMALKGYNK